MTAAEPLIRLSCKQPIVVVCKIDRRSARAAGELLAAGYQEVAVLRGGTDGGINEGWRWKRARIERYRRRNQ
jgi:rhodanese-related sulfurtransferase